MIFKLIVKKNTEIFIYIYIHIKREIKSLADSYKESHNHLLDFAHGQQIAVQCDVIIITLLHT
jgi:hypothetical protein